MWSSSQDILLLKVNAAAGLGDQPDDSIFDHFCVQSQGRTSELCTFDRWDCYWFAKIFGMGLGSINLWFIRRYYATDFCAPLSGNLVGIGHHLDTVPGSSQPFDLRF